MTNSEVDWRGLKDSWDTYKGFAEAWVHQGIHEDLDPQAVDDLIHHLIVAHEDWNERLGKTIEATHHH